MLIFNLSSPVPALSPHFVVQQQRKAFESGSPYVEDGYCRGPTTYGWRNRYVEPRTADRVVPDQVDRYGWPVRLFAPQPASEAILSVRLSVRPCGCSVRLMAVMTLQTS